MCHRTTMTTSFQRRHQQGTLHRAPKLSLNRNHASCLVLSQWIILRLLPRSRSTVALRPPNSTASPSWIRVPPSRSSHAAPGSTWCDRARPRLSAKHKPHHDLGDSLEHRPRTEFHRCPLERSVLAQRPTDRVTSGLDVHRPLRGHATRCPPRSRPLDEVQRVLLPHLAPASER